MLCATVRSTLVSSAPFPHRIVFVCILHVSYTLEAREVGPYPYTYNAKSIQLGAVPCISMWQVHTDKVPNICIESFL